MNVLIPLGLMLLGVVALVAAALFCRSRGACSLLD